MIVDCAVYKEGRRREGDVAVEQAVAACREPGAFSWIGLYEPSEAEFESIRTEFGLHELAVEDAIHAHQRPKLEVFGEMVFIVLKTARYVDSTEVIQLGEILVAPFTAPAWTPLFTLAAAVVTDYGSTNFLCNPSSIDGFSIINSSQGGGTKDTWVLRDEAPAPGPRRREGAS